MSWPTWSEIAQILTALAVCFSAALSWRNGRKIDEVHKATNGMQAQMIRSAGLEGEAKGRAEEQQRPTV